MPCVPWEVPSEVPWVGGAGGAASEERPCVEPSNELWEVPGVGPWVVEPWRSRSEEAVGGAAGRAVGGAVGAAST